MPDLDAAMTFLGELAKEFDNSWLRKGMYMESQEALCEKKLQLLDWCESRWKFVVEVGGRYHSRVFAVEMAYQQRAADKTIKDDNVEGRLVQIHNMRLLYSIICAVDIYGEINRLNVKYQGQEPLICEVVEDVQKLCLILDMYRDGDIDKCGSQEKLFWKQLCLINTTENPPPADIRSSRSGVIFNLEHGHQWVYKKLQTESEGDSLNQNIGYYFITKPSSLLPRDDIEILVDADVIYATDEIKSAFKNNNKNYFRCN